MELSLPRPPAFTGHAAFWCPDFPPAGHVLPHACERPSAIPLYTMSCPATRGNVRTQTAKSVCLPHGGALRNRQTDCECGALSGGTYQIHGSTMRLRNVFHNGQAQARPPGTA